MDLGLGYLNDCRSLAEVESIKPVKCRVRVYELDFYVVFDCPYLHKYTCRDFAEC